MVIFKQMVNPAGLSVLNPYGFGLSLLGFLCFLSLGLALYFFLKFRTSSKLIAEQKRHFQEKLNYKDLEVAKMVDELQATQLKLLESGKISALASLSAGILHQISQPITAIHGFVKFLKKEMNPKDTFYRPICLIEEQSIYLKQMLEDLMELIRHRKIKKDNIHVNDIVMRSMNLLKDELRIRRINWDLDLGENLPLVYADGIHLQQIFMNIVSNAIQALGSLPPGAERYLAICSKFNQDDHHIHISFKDSGPGIMETDKVHIFEPFFSTKSKGGGLGLALCKDLIAEHGGSLSVESRPNEGANFIIKLPCVESRQQTESFL